MSSRTPVGPTATSGNGGWQCPRAKFSAARAASWAAAKSAASTDPTADTTGWIEVWDSNDYVDEQAVFRLYCSGLFQQRGHL